MHDFFLNPDQVNQTTGVKATLNMLEKPKHGDNQGGRFLHSVHTHKALPHPHMSNTINIMYTMYFFVSLQNFLSKAQHMEIILQ